LAKGYGDRIERSRGYLQVLDVASRDPRGARG
jgi:hypothetical protein